MRKGGGVKPRWMLVLGVWPAKKVVGEKGEGGLQGSCARATRGSGMREGGERGHVVWEQRGRRAGCG